MTATALLKRACRNAESPHRQLDIFYNTVGLDESEKKRLAEINGLQAREIYKFFLSNLQGQFTPFDVAIHTGLHAPITSIRRAITNLTRAGYLVKTNRKKEGLYGMLNHTWQLYQEK